MAMMSMQLQLAVQAGRVAVNRELLVSPILLSLSLSHTLFPYHPLLRHHSLFLSLALPFLLSRSPD